MTRRPDDFSRRTTVQITNEYKFLAIEYKKPQISKSGVGDKEKLSNEIRKSTGNCRPKCRRTDIAKVRALDGRRDGQRAVRGAEGTGHKPLQAGASGLLIGGSACESRGLYVHAIGERLHAVVGLRDARRRVSVRLDNLGTRLQVGLRVRGKIVEKARGY